MPVPDQNQDHLRLAATFMVTDDITPGSRLLTTVSFVKARARAQGVKRRQAK
jgi:hypothetical protein